MRIRTKSGKLKIKIKKLTKTATIPTKGTDGAACYDVYADIVGEAKLINPHSTMMINTGLSFEIPNGYACFVYPRSGLAAKHNIRLENCTGVIDSDYRGELMIALHNDSEYNSYYVTKGERIAQILFAPVNDIEFEPVDELSDSKRGKGGFGSTGRC